MWVIETVQFGENLMFLFCVIYSTCRRGLPWVVGLLCFAVIQDCIAQDKQITTAAELVRSRRKLDETVWKSELLAQEHENTFVKLWDNLIHQRDKFDVFRGFKFESILLPSETTRQVTDHDINILKGNGTNRNLTRQQFQTLLSQYEATGYSIIESEWHHQAFEPAKDNAPAKSIVSVLLHVTHDASNSRFIVRGDLRIKWKNTPDQTSKTVQSIWLVRMNSGCLRSRTWSRRERNRSA